MVISYSTREPRTIEDVVALGWHVDEEASKEYEQGKVVTDGTYSAVVYFYETHMELDRKLSSFCDSLVSGLGMLSEFSDEYWQLPWMKEVST